MPPSHGQADVQLLPGGQGLSTGDAGLGRQTPPRTALLHPTAPEPSWLSSGYRMCLWSAGDSWRQLAWLCALHPTPWGRMGTRELLHGMESAPHCWAPGRRPECYQPCLATAPKEGLLPGALPSCQPDPAHPPSSAAQSSILAATGRSSAGLHSWHTQGQPQQDHFHCKSSVGPRDRQPEAGG